MKTLLVRGLLIFGCTLFIGIAQAETKAKGWSGSVGLLLGGVNGEGQLDAYGGKKRIQSLDKKSIRYDYSFLFPIFKTNYTFQNNMTIYADADSFGGGVGIRYVLDDKTNLSVYLPLFLGTSSNIWQDPYLTGKDRKKTDAKLDAAIGVSIDNIWGSFASINYLYQDLSVKNDQAGQSLNFRLTPIEIKQLKRSKKSHNISVSFPPLILGKGFNLIGGTDYTRANAEGKANSFTAYNVNLMLVYEIHNIELFSRISVGEAKYSAVNSVFDTQRKDALNTISTGITYKKPFNWKNISLELMIFSEDNNSNINFYDTRNNLLMTSFHYHY